MAVEDTIDMSQFESVLSAASQLPVAERLQLIDALAATVPDDCPPTLSPEWLAEIRRRSAEIDAGAVKTIPWEQVRSEIFKKVGLDRAD
jgi:putative addiction module component (TIGR02574 family)